MKKAPKELSEMTLQELWELFPIALVPHDGKWKAQYREEERLLQTALADVKVAMISHIGSTAVEGIMSKNIVDILVEIGQEEDMPRAAERIVGCGYLEMSRDERRMSFNKGYTKYGYAKKVFHLHLRFEGDNDELYFRDRLIDRPELAKEYERLKIDLAKKFEHDRDAYTDAKSQFVRAVTEEARRAYGDRY